MSEIIKKLGLGGWFENKDPMCLNDKLEPVAPRHHEIAIKKKADEMKQWGKTNIMIDEEQSVEITIFVPRGEVESAKKAIERFCREQGICGLIRHEINDVLCLEIPISRCGKVFAYLANSRQINWGKMYCKNPKLLEPSNDPHSRKSNKRELEEYDEEAEEREQEEYYQWRKP